METKDFFEKVSDSVSKAAVVTADVAKTVAEITKLNYDSARKRDDIRKAYSAIGKKYFELHQEEPDDDYAEFVTTILAAQAKIAENKVRIDELKNKEKEA